MTVLRMPKFSLSAEEAQALVDYSAAVEKRANPDNGLVYPYTKTPQRSELTGDYWKDKTRDFMKQLEQHKLSDQEKKTYAVVWRKMQAETQDRAKTELKAAQAA